MTRRRSIYAQSFRKVFENVLETGGPQVLMDVYEKVMTTGEPPELYREFWKALQKVAEKTPKEQRDAAEEQAVARCRAWLESLPRIN